ncbi:heterokaryon incompatibility protein-domain-containing protein [Mariannaea sp. PMI_226]|nr:heterokaryon incompatibility protein-domain-containing protein [Mariannaea sp. PMI_226]
MKRELIYDLDSDESSASFEGLDSVEKAQSKYHVSVSSFARNILAKFKDKTYAALPPHNDSIRLVTLLPGKGESKVQCSLTAVRLSDNPKYEALSYTWGDPKFPRRSISLDGDNFVVRDNLWWALVYLRHPTEPRVLWIDAISIDQKNISERNSQVKLMGLIFSQASSVVIWLGRATTGSRLSMALLNEVASSSGSTDESVLKMITSRPGVERKLRRLFHLRLYWTRQWILQEAILAKDITIHCGGDTLPWEAFQTAVERIKSLSLYIKSSKISIEGFSHGALVRAFDGTFSVLLDTIRSRLQSSSSREIDLRRVIGISQWSKCSVMSDKIYGLLGMLASTIPVDYNKSIFDVYVDALQHLRHPSVRGSADLYDLYTVRFSRLLQRLLKGPVANPGSTVSCFMVQGLIGGEILGLADLSTSYDSQEARARASDLIIRYSEAMEESKRASLSQLVDKFSFEYNQGSHLSSKPCEPHHFRATLEQEVSNIEVPEVLPRSGNVPVPKTSVETRSPPRLFISTSLKPLIGYAPSSAQTGDLLVRFLMSDTSILIRPSVDGYTFVGRASVPRLPDSSSDLSSETLEIDHDPVSSDPIIVDDLKAYKQRITITLDAETLQFISNYWEFEGMRR